MNSSILAALCHILPVLSELFQGTIGFLVADHEKIIKITGGTGEESRKGVWPSPARLDTENERNLSIS